MATFVNSWKFILLNVIVLLIFISLVIKIILIYRAIVIRTRRNERGRLSEEQSEINVKKIRVLKKKEINQIAILIVVVCILVCAVVVRAEYRQKEKYVWTGENENIDLQDFFEEEPDSQQNLHDKELHMEWYMEMKEKNLIKEGKITSNMISEYGKKFDNIYFPKIKKEDEQDKKETAETKKFASMVGTNIEELSQEELWEGYLSGESAPRTSENVFQRAVLAEGTHAKSFKGYEVINGSTLMFAGGAVGKFEEFLKFSSRNAGNEKYIDANQVSFRIGKIVYREACNEQNVGTDYEIHFVVWAFCNFAFSVSETKEDDKEYLTKLYYWSLTCELLNRFMTDKDYEEYYKKVKVCWQKISTEYIRKHRVENINVKDMVNFRDRFIEKRWYQND